MWVLAADTGWVRIVGQVPTDRYDERGYPRMFNTDIAKIMHSLVTRPLALHKKSQGLNRCLMLSGKGTVIPGYDIAIWQRFSSAFEIISDL